MKCSIIQSKPALSTGILSNLLMLNLNQEVVTCLYAWFLQNIINKLQSNLPKQSTCYKQVFKSKPSRIAQQAILTDTSDHLIIAVSDHSKFLVQLSIITADCKKSVVVNFQGVPVFVLTHLGEVRDK